MPEISDYTKTFVNQTARVLSNGVSKFAALPSEVVQLPKEAFDKTDEAQQAIIRQANQLKNYALKNGNSAVSKKPSPSPSAPGPNPAPKTRRGESRLINVHIKSAKAQLPGGGLMEKVGLYHQWIDGPHFSAGMGNLRGVPGENGQTSPDLPFSPTQVVNHHGRDYQHSRFVRGLDSGALKAWTEEGRRTGPWTPVLNDCNTFVHRAIKNSTPQDVFFPSIQDALPGGFDGRRDPFNMPPAPPPLRNVVIYPDGTYHKAATKY